ncbi:aminotransferase class III-fold pyridoxal phosphate-dependent enzyme [Tunturiibacter empetritectus]|uniref:aminotransferase class III-fold pyridoxal phosphate-dependent enzyme n=1 Tax=Tunturiibacter empetritectus TaxID=3069691 RepID=UPI003D9B4DA9
MSTLTEKTPEDLKQNSAQGVTPAIRSMHYAEFGPKLKTALPGPNAKKIVADDDRLISPSYTRSYPMVAKSGRGIRVTDVDGNEFLDFAAGIAVNSTGHCHPEVVKAIQDQAAELIHMSGTDFYYQNMTTLAERLSAIAPMPGPHKFYYGNSGAEAVECAMKLARYHTGRQNIISFFGAFHGRTMGALSLTGSKPQQKRRFAPSSPASTTSAIPMLTAAVPTARQKSRKPSPSTAPATSKTASSRPSSRPKRLPPSSSSPSRAKAATS